MPVVAPCRLRRQRHQDCFGAPVRLQPEQRAAVLHEIELDVATAPVELELALALAMGVVAMALDERQVSRDERLGDALRQRERAPAAIVGEVVEEDATDAAWLTAVLQEKIIVARPLHRRMHIGAERQHGVAAGAMEVPRIVVGSITGRQIHAATEPAHRCCAIARFGNEHPHVHVHCRHMGVARMQDQRHAGRLPCQACKLRPRKRCRGRQARAAHVGIVDATALEHVAVLDQPRNATAALGPGPRIAQERPALDRLECGADALLQRGEPCARRCDAGGVHPLRAASARWPMSVRNCMPSKPMRAIVSYAIFCAWRTESPSAVTHSTRPPVTTTESPSSAVPAWKTLTGAAASSTSSRPRMMSALRGASGYPAAATTTPSAVRRSHCASASSSVPSIACTTMSTKSDLRRIRIGCVSGSPRRQLNSSARGCPSASIITPAYRKPV